jgi:hypothetical protein
MSVRFFKYTADFAENIRQALREGQEPVLSLYVDPFYEGNRRNDFLLLGTGHSQRLYITKEDANWDVGTVGGHAVVIGSKSMKVGEELAIKDSNFEEAWWVESSNVLVPPQRNGAKVCEAHIATLSAREFKATVHNSTLQKDVLDDNAAKQMKLDLAWIYVPEKA